MSVTIVGSVLVRDEDVWVEQAIRNVSSFCDVIHVQDHGSTDGTARILRPLAREFDHVDVRRSLDARDSHRALERYAGTSTWVLGVDGDELYDPTGLDRLRGQLLGGAHTDAFRVRPWILHCDELDPGAVTATGYLSPPSRVTARLFNFGALDEWKGGPERLHGDASFKPGYDRRTELDLYREYSWDDDPLHYLHLCFLPRSSREGNVPGGRPNLAETGAYRRGFLRSFARRIRPAPLSDEYAAAHAAGLSWKRAKYARGDRVTVDATPFLREVPRGHAFSARTQTTSS